MIRNATLWALALVVPALAASCAWVGEEEFLDALDQDGDGYYPSSEFGDGAVDCDDLNPLIYPGAPDVRGDGCDADCLGTENDADGDDWPDDADCAPDDPEIFPCAVEQAGDDIDQDCDGDPDTRREFCGAFEEDGRTKFALGGDNHGLDPDYPPSPTATFDGPEQDAVAEAQCGNPAPAYAGGGE